MSLAPADQKRLALVLKAARELELSWPKIDRDLPRDLGDHPVYQELKRCVAACASADSESLRRL